VAFASEAELLVNREAVAQIEREIKKTLRDLAQFEMPRKVLLVGRDFTIENGELTPTLKVKRRIVEQNYKNEIEAMYVETAEHPTLG
jgi:long-chain acyl-CoA synthetase